MLELFQWRYVHSSCNLADLVGRGLLATDLVKRKIFVNGPAFLAADYTDIFKIDGIRSQIMDANS